ncbi:hypothetical protein Y032_0071g590 [Ancylostoma ceylanicum]|nr:hypothetical protein Y032_0071g590 [Ancylostoma ceylanicum]
MENFDYNISTLPNLSGCSKHYYISKTYQNAEIFDQYKPPIRQRIVFGVLAFVESESPIHSNNGDINRNMRVEGNHMTTPLEECDCLTLPQSPLVSSF